MRSSGTRPAICWLPAQMTAQQRYSLSHYHSLVATRIYCCPLAFFILVFSANLLKTCVDADMELEAG
jgi:hypothetical protein